MFFVGAIGGLFGQNSVTFENSNEYRYKNVFKISPVQFANSTFELNYERYFGNRSSSLLISPSLLLREQNSESLIGFKWMTQYRFYFSQLRRGLNKTWIFANIGFYGGPYVQYLYAKEDYRGGYYDDNIGVYYDGIFNKEVSTIEGGVITGFQFDLLPRLVVDFYFGGGIKYAVVEDTIGSFLPENYTYNYGILDREYTGVIPRGGLQIGFNF